MAVAQTISAGLTLAETVFQAMQNAEASFPAGSGSSKKAVAVAAGVSLLNTAGAITGVNAGDIVTGVENLVELIGAIKGMFSKHQPTGPVSPVAPIGGPVPVTNPVPVAPISGPVPVVNPLPVATDPTPVTLNSTAGSTGAATTSSIL